MNFDEIITFDQEKYEDNIVRHGFVDEDGRYGEVQDE